MSLILKCHLIDKRMTQIDTFPSIFQKPYIVLLTYFYLINFFILQVCTSYF